MHSNRVFAAVTGVAGLVAGWAVGAALGRPGDTAFREVTTTTTEAAVETPTLGGQVHAMRGWELILARGDEPVSEGATSVETWQSNWQAPGTRPMPGDMRLVAWNADRSRIGGLDTSARPVLYTGRGDALEPIAVAVASFAWHVTDPDVLVWTTENGELWRWDLESGPVLVTSRLDAGAQVILAADWGYAAVAEGTVIRLGPRGGLGNVAPGELSPGFGFPAIGRPIIILGEQGETRALLEPATGKRIDLDFSPSHAIFAADGSRYALAQPAGLGETRILVRDGETVVADLTLPESVFLGWRGDVIVMAQLQEEPASAGTGTVRPLYFVDLGADTAIRVEYRPGFVAGGALRER